MSNVAKLKKKAAELEQKKQFDKALAVYVQFLEAARRDARRRRRRRCTTASATCYCAQGNVADAVDYYEQAVDLYADARLPQQRHRALQQDPAAIAGPRLDLLQARQDQRAEGLQERREEELPRVRRPDAEGREDRRGVPRAEGIRRSLSRSGRHPADARRAADARRIARARRSSSCRCSTTATIPKAARPRRARRSIACTRSTRAWSRAVRRPLARRKRAGSFSSMWVARRRSRVPSTKTEKRPWRSRPGVRYAGARPAAAGIRGASRPRRDYSYHADRRFGGSA